MLKWADAYLYQIQWYYYGWAITVTHVGAQQEEPWRTGSVPLAAPLRL